MLRAGALGRPRGMGWGGRWERGSGWGTHVNPWLIHVNVWQKPLQYCKGISLQLIKINEKKKTCLENEVIEEEGRENTEEGIKVEKAKEGKREIRTETQRQRRNEYETAVSPELHVWVWVASLQSGQAHLPAWGTGH